MRAKATCVPTSCIGYGYSVDDIFEPTRPNSRRGRNPIAAKGRGLIDYHFMRLGIASNKIPICVLHFPARCGLSWSAEAVNMHRQRGKGIGELSIP